jgi:catechol 2,3-dioxygenase-like lactoylglutathione lyase family enzyme
VGGIELDHVQIAAPPGCENAARSFYGALLGMAEVPKPDALAGRGGVWFQSGSLQLHVGVEEGFAPALKAHPAFSVPDASLDELFERLAVAGVDVAWDDALAPLRRFYAADPWGNRIELLGR